MKYSLNALVSRMKKSAVAIFSGIIALNAYCDGDDSLIYPTHAYEPFVMESMALTIPIGERFGFEVAEYNNPTPVDMYELSLLSLYDFAAYSLNDYSYSKPLVFRITVQGYSLFDSYPGGRNYFSFDKGLEDEIRRPRFLMSITQHF
ncbi:hypothetical protein [Pleionea sediminis]|uniref:hypothetical protein n=1 Tax=Pleionea sediminis TaxID=2569479 RepID=UPI001185BE9C|nr:hypothetical protein [Pleionea sediminis]